MRIEAIDNGFAEFMDHPCIEKVICKYDSTCTVWFQNKSFKTLKVNCSVYNRQYGIPVSNDGTKLFVGDWERGLSAFDIQSGEQLWRFRPGGIRNVFVFPEYLVVARAYKEVVKIDIETGERCASIKSGTIDQIFSLSGPYVFADTISGHHCIIDAEKMVITEKISPKSINPHACLSLMIQDVKSNDHSILVIGREDYPQKQFDSDHIKNGMPFSRRIEVMTDWTGRKN